MTRLKDIASKAGVSEATVSLVLNNKPGVNAKTRSRVIRIADEMNYSPNSIARSLVMKKSQTIGLVVTDIENPFYGSFVHHCSDYTQSFDYSLLIAESSDNLSTEDTIIENFLSKQVDGIIIAPCQEQRKDYSLFKRMDAQKIPYVFSVSYYEKYNKSFVLTDYKLGTYRLTKYLLESGHRSIVHLIGSNLESPLNKERVNGYNQAFNDARIPIDPSLTELCNQADFFSGYQHTKNILNNTKPDAVIAINDILALGARQAISEFGLNIPCDISLAGYDDVMFASILETPLTTVRQNIEQIARKSIDLLIQKIVSDKPIHAQIQIQPELVVRETTGSC